MGFGGPSLCDATCSASFHRFLDKCPTSGAQLSWPVQRAFVASALSLNEFVPSDGAHSTAGASISSQLGGKRHKTGRKFPNSSESNASGALQSDNLGAEVVDFGLVFPMEMDMYRSLLFIVRHKHLNDCRADSG